MTNLYRMHRQIADQTIDEIADVANFVSWRATAHGGKRKSRKGGRSR